MMKENESSPFVIKQLEEALEERQNSDRRKEQKPISLVGQEDRRQNDRRNDKKASSK